MGNRRSKYTPEQRAERDAADTAIKDAADQKLADPAAVAAMVAQLARTTSPKLLRYSLRNVAMLWNQAEERGMTLTDVDSFKGWRARGRSVRKGERALRIVAPKGAEKTEGGDTAEQEPAEFITLDADDQGEDTATRTRFRMVGVFDISQTDGVEDLDGEPVVVEPVADPVAVVRANLTSQLERLGYAVATTGDEQPAPLVDDDAHAVTVSAAQPVEQLAQAVAELITRPADQRPRPVHPAPVAAAESRPAAAPGIPLDLGEFGEGRAAVEIDNDHGRAYYRVTASNVRGCFTVAFYEPAEQREPRKVNVVYGHDNGRGGPWAHGGEGEKRPERPTVNGIRLVAQSTHITLTEIETMRTIYVSRMVAGRYNNSHSERVPDRTEQRTRAVVRAILRHFAQLPELPELFRRAAALDAPALQRIHNERAGMLSAQIARLEHQRADAEAQRGYYASLAAGGEIDGTQLEMFPA